MRYWNEHFETMSQDEMRNVQSERLVKLVRNVYDNVPHYRQKMIDKGIVPEDIKSVDDLKKLPFTVKQDLRDTYPFGLFATPQSEIVRIHASSGTTGKKTVVGYTSNDIQMWADCVARGMTSMGISKEDIIQVAYGYGLFTGGLGVHYGSEKVGATVIPISGGNTSRQIETMIDYGSTVIACTPSYALYIADEMLEAGYTKDDIKLRVGIFGAEPWSIQMRQDLEDKLGIIACNIYGLSEVMGPGVSCDCLYRNGMHIQEDNFIAEIIDPATEEVLPDGEKGELVFTTITKEGLPLIRYRTRDITTLTHEKCQCGRTTARMSRVTGRTDDMLIIRGVNVFPSQIESVLLKMGDCAPHYQLIVDRSEGLDTLEVHVEMTSDLFSDEIKKIEVLENKIRHELASILGINAKVKLVEPKTIERSEGKAKRVIDKRTY